MFSAAPLALALFMSVPVLAGVSFAEKVERVHLMKSLAGKSALVDLEVYDRELSYENKGLSTGERANLEISLLISRMEESILLAFEAAFKELGTPEAAAANVRSGIERDLELADPSIKAELSRLAIEALLKVQSGGLSKKIVSKQLFEKFYRQSLERSSFLNLEECCDGDPVKGADRVNPGINASKDSEKKHFRSKQELIESLVSDRESTRWVSSSNQTMSTEVIRRREGNISLQVKFEFLGVSLNAGPEISFKREFNTNATIMAEGLRPALLQDGNFDFFKRDKNGNIVVKGGKDQKRFMSFYCSSDLHFKTEYTGGGGFKFMGVGADGSVSTEYKNSVNLTSRRIALPEYLENQTVTLKYISDLCHLDFLNARVSTTLSIRQSLELMMKNLVASLRFAHPKTKCAVDEHCFNWYNKEILALARVKNYPRCVEERREKYRACELRGLPGQKCAVYDKSGTRISDGMFEFVCDRGLKCVQTRAGGWFTNWEIYQYPTGQCRAINPKTYKDPFAEQDNYIEIELL